MRTIRRLLPALAGLVLLLPFALAAQIAPLAEDGAVKVGVVKNPYHGERNVPELSMNPDYIHAAGLERLLGQWNALLTRPVREVRLTDEEQAQYGEWHRLGMANGHLAEIVSEHVREDLVTIGLEANCNSILGVLGGLQRSGPEGESRRVGMIFIDAHGDFNTPETTLSGMLGGMPVAVAAGHALERLRLESGLIDPIPLEEIVWAGVRDLDPLEADRFEEYGVRQISVHDIRTLSENLHRQMRYLSQRNDLVYIHIDMDVLDPAEVPGHGLNVPDGPTSEELAAALRTLFEYPKAAALGIASTPAGSDDPDGVSRQAALNLIRGAVEGVKARDSNPPAGR